MKTIFTIIIFLVTGISYLSAQDQAVAPSAATVTWNEKTHDFGNVMQNDPTKATFTFTNTGTIPVVITSAKSSCGCTVAEYTKEPVRPGEKGEVKATYNSAKVGKFTKTVTVSFEGNTSPEVLVIKGEVEAKPAE